ncbi:TPA: restriction endonuclease subunit S [Staphylococcus pseudintermedius]
MEFKKVKLGEISIITMGQSPKSEFYSEIDGTPFLQGNRTFQHIYPVIDIYTKKVTKLANANDILFSVRAPVGDINIAPVDLCIGRGLCAIRSINNNQEFLFYLLKSIINELESQATGTIFSSVNKKTLENFIVNIPNEKQQKNIGTILFNLDKKIELNQKIIANLEELSQTLFKHWFVDFEFPNENGNPYKSSGGEMIDSELGNIPRDWEVNELGNYVDIIKGLSYKGAFLDKQHERSDSFPLLSISNFNFISGFKSNKTKYYFGDYKERHLVNPGDILIAATDLTQDRKILGAPAIVPNLNKTMIFSLDVFKITETTIPKYVLYFLLQSAKYREFVEGSATGTTVIRIAKNVILKVPIVIDKDISLKFDNLIKPYMEKIEHLSHENQKLTQLRDTLLPKLMSGEIEIPDDIEVNEDELSI